MEFKLNNGKSIPAVGLGTWQATGDEGYKAVLHALSVGYRHIDSAVGYDNEKEVGRALGASDVPRDQVFVTTKITNSILTKADAATQIDESLSNFGTDYIDLVLIHWPWTYERNAEVYAAMEDAVDAGKIRTIGVSNFNIHHIDAILKSARIKPAINQMECHISLQNTRMQEYLEGKGMVLEAYAPMKSWKISEVLENKTLGKIGGAHGKTPTQVSLRWLIQRGVVALPKSVTPARIEENFQLFDFELTDDEMHAIRKLNKAERLFPEPDNVDFGFLEL
jgi:diketogulonate reductase-like aldo/keto reductase